MLTFLETYGVLIFGAIGVVLLVGLSIMDVFNKTICGDDEDE